MARNSQSSDKKHELGRPRNGFALAALNRKGGFHEDTEKSSFVKEGCFDCGSPSTYRYGLCRSCCMSNIIGDEDDSAIKY